MARLWGARSLAPLYPEKSNLIEPIGEAWLTGVDCQISTGPFVGRTLGQAWREMAVGWRGSEFKGGTDFPLLLKFIFPTEKLSIQVHPGDEYAAAHEGAAGGRGKTEMWYAVTALPGARLLAGLKTGVTKERFLAALADHTLENIFQSHEVHAGDTFFIPAGIPHTIGPGMIICEVQQYSDLTYRIYDYDRRDAKGDLRELHVEKAMEVLNFDASFHAKVRTGPRSIHDARPWEDLVDCPYFSVEKLAYEKPVHQNVQKPGDRFSLWVFLEGEGEISWSCLPFDAAKSSFGQFSYKPGECWFVPAVFGSHGYYPKTKTTLLVASPGNPTPAPRKNSNAS